jgi:type IV pilus assembly protein PilC
MPLYKYRAMNRTGGNISGTLNAVSVMDLESNLRAMGLDLIRHGEIRRHGLLSLIQKRVTNDDLVQMCVHLEQLDRAGVPLLDALHDVRETTDCERLRDIVAQVVKNVGEGMYLSAALEQHPEVFGAVFTGVVAAGEQSGDMAHAFDHLARHLKWQSEMAQKIRMATRYPLFLLVMVMGVVFMMMTFVVPQVSEFLLSTSGELPFMTRTLIATSNLFADYWWLILGLPLVGIGVGGFMARISEGFAYRLDAMKFRLPGIGPVLKKLALARFAHFFGLSFQSGVDVLSCIETGSRVVGNRVLADALRAARRNVLGGSSLSESLDATGQFPHLVVRMFKIGEDTGKLNEALENIGYFYDREVDNSVRQMIGLIEPALTITVGGIVLWVAVGVLGPVYDNIGAVGF